MCKVYAASTHMFTWVFIFHINHVYVRGCVLLSAALLFLSQHCDIFLVHEEPRADCWNPDFKYKDNEVISQMKLLDL